MTLCVFMDIMNGNGLLKTVPTDRQIYLLAITLNVIAIFNARVMYVCQCMRWRNGRIDWHRDKKLWYCDREIIEMMTTQTTTITTYLFMLLRCRMVNVIKVKFMRSTVNHSFDKRQTRRLNVKRAMHKYHTTHREKKKLLKRKWMNRWMNEWMNKTVKLDDFASNFNFWAIFFRVCYCLSSRISMYHMCSIDT